MSNKQWRVRPTLNAPKEGVWLGPGSSKGDGLRLGTLAEAVSGPIPSVWLATAKEQVVAVVGKRGSGKSFTLGVIAEGFGAGSQSIVFFSIHWMFIGPYGFRSEKVKMLRRVATTLSLNRPA